MKVRTTITVAGRVQGVAFRNYTQKTAFDLGVRGWVRNLPNGDVEGCFEGDDAAVRALVEWCRSGPPAARVERMTVGEGVYTGEFGSFDIRY
jgi:acylphosphatase